MRLTRYPSARAFLDEVEPFLLASEAENVLMLGLAHSLARGESATAVAPYFSAVLADARVLGAAFSNRSDRAGVSQSAEPAAMSLLELDFREARPQLRSIGGPDPTARTIATEYARRTGRTIVSRMGTRIHQLDAVTHPPRWPSGSLRVAVESDSAILIRWVEEFLRDIGDEGDPRQVVSERVPSGQIFVWDDGGPVSMAAWAGKTPNGVRVNLVFTPEALRSRGYASATVATLSQHLLDEGNAFCALYTDVANPISNAICLRMGYRPVCEAGMYFLSGG